MNVKIKKLNSEAIIPTYGSEGAAAFDLYALEDTGVFMPTLISTGISMEVPKGYVLLVAPRSSIGLKTTLRMPHSTGVIDSDYRGEIKVMYESMEPMVIKKGERIAQGMIIPVAKVNFEEVKELSSTDRGDGGFGSTGV